MARLHLRFQNFHVNTLAAAQALFDAKPWRLETDAEKMAIGQAFVDAISTHHNIPTAIVEITGSQFRYGFQPALVMEDDNGETTIDAPRILLDKWSITTLFNFVRVHMLAHQAVEPTSENDPFAWSCSLFYAVKPVMFRARAREGRVRGVSARDTYSRETWLRLEAEGLTDGDYLISRERATAMGPTSLQDDENPVLPDPALNELLDEDADNLPDEDETDQPRSGDGLDALGIVALRRLSRGVVSGGYSLSKPDLIAALRAAGVAA